MGETLGEIQEVTQEETTVGTNNLEVETMVGTYSPELGPGEVATNNLLNLYATLEDTTKWFWSLSVMLLLNKSKGIMVSCRDIHVV